MRSGLPGTGTGTTQWFRKTWRKLHLSRGNILTSEPTTEHVGDETVAARSSRTCRRTGRSTDFRSRTAASASEVHVRFVNGTSISSLLPNIAA